MSNFKEIAGFIWNVADDILRNVFKQHEYGDTVLPFVVLRRLDCIHEAVQNDVLAAYKEYSNKLNEDQLEPVLIQATKGLKFYNKSEFDMQRLSQDAKNIDMNFSNYLNGYSKNIYDIIENFQLTNIAKRLAKNDVEF